MRSFPWDSLVTAMGDDGFPIYDRSYMASDWHEVYKTFFSNGVFMDTDEALQVTEGEGMTVIVSPGKTHINGVIGWETDERELIFTAPSSEPRIDTVVLRWDINVDARMIDLYVKKGVSGSTPKRPELKRTESVWELGLADVFIPANSSSISADRISDTRLETERCGIVAPFEKLDTTTFYNQLDAAIQMAIDLSREALNETVAGNFQTRITDLENNKVNRDGDTMTGNLTLDSGDGSYRGYTVVRKIDENNAMARFGIASNGVARLEKWNDDGSAVANSIDLHESKIELVKLLSLPSSNIDVGKKNSSTYTHISVSRMGVDGTKRTGILCGDSTTGLPELVAQKDGVNTNYMRLGDSDTEFAKPVKVDSGGTGNTIGNSQGLVSPRISSGDNNTIGTSKPLSSFNVYEANSAVTNNPATTDWHYIMNFSSQDSNYDAQLAIPMSNTNGAPRFRVRTSGTWHSWTPFMVLNDSLIIGDYMVRRCTTTTTLAKGTETIIPYNTDVWKSGGSFESATNGIKIKNGGSYLVFATAWVDSCAAGNALEMHIVGYSGFEPSPVIIRTGGSEDQPHIAAILRSDAGSTITVKIANWTQAGTRVRNSSMSEFGIMRIT